MFIKNRPWNLGFGFGLILLFTFIRGLISNVKSLDKAIFKNKYLGPITTYSYYGALIAIITIYILPQFSYDYDYFTDSNCSSCGELANSEIIQCMLALVLFLFIFPWYLNPTKTFGVKIRNPIYWVLWALGGMLLIVTLAQYYFIYEDENVKDRCAPSESLVTMVKNATIG